MPVKRRSVLVLGFVLLLASVLFSGAEARPAAVNTTWPRTLIDEPCISGSFAIQRPTAGPARVVCRGKTGQIASVNVPTPWLSDREPELSLVSIPTFFNLQWDRASLGAQDSQSLTIPYPPGNPTDKLINVRVQLRLRALDYPKSNSESRIVAANIALESQPPASRTYIADAVTPSDVHNIACLTDKDHNEILSVGDESGGYKSPPCQTISHDLSGIDVPDVAGFLTPAFGDAKTQRYPGWTNSLPVSQFLVFTPFASIYGQGTDRGSPAFQVAATTRFQVEARVVWDEHQYRKETVDTECRWSYRDDYDFIDWDRWPGPIYCRRNVTVTWPTYCKPFYGGCDYGHPNDWWVPYVPFTDVEALRRPDGTYGETYDFVSVQSQALLTTP